MYVFVQGPEVLTHEQDEHAKAGVRFLAVSVSNRRTHTSGDSRGGGPHQQLHPAFLCELTVCPQSRL